MSKELLKDETFLRIRRLNSLNNGDERKSVILSDEYSDDIDDAYSTAALKNLEPETESDNAEVPSVIGNDKGSSTSGEVIVDDNEASGVLPDGDDVKQVEANYHHAKSTVSSSGTEEHVFKSHVNILHSKEKVRYKRNSKESISYFGDVKFQNRPSILDGSLNNPFQENFSGPRMEKINYNDGNSVTIVASDFGGLYVLAWMAVAFSSMKILVEYYYQHGGFQDSEILRFMTTDLFTIAIIDFSMYANIWVIYLIQWLCKKEIMSWQNLGWKITSVFEFSFVIFYIILPENIFGLHWIAKIFLFLHSLVLLMKMHSFAFFNGYLWNIKKELEYSVTSLKKYDGVADKELLDTLERSKTFCLSELNATSEDQRFPSNINIKNYFMYTMFPTLVYQIEYPRTKGIRWKYVFEKLFAIFGTIFIMMVVAQTFMYPVAIRAIGVRTTEWKGPLDRFQQYFLLLVDIVPGFIVMYILNFYLIWDAILNCIAELTCFADRYFYGDWWNCVDWGDFSRIWNIPVHKFLLRHVYHSSMSFLSLSKSQATLMTFVISAIVHELAMYVLFKKLRFYLFFFQMCQLPLVAISKTKFFKDKTIINNVFFWVGICTGPSVMCTLYLTF